MRRAAARTEREIQVSNMGGVACGGKRMYDTFTEAKRIADSARRHGIGRVQPYHCTSCNKFHIGSANRASIKRPARQPAIDET